MQKSIASFHKRWKYYSPTTASVILQGYEIRLFSKLMIEAASSVMAGGNLSGGRWSLRLCRNVTVALVDFWRECIQGALWLKMVGNQFVFICFIYLLIRGLPSDIGGKGLKLFGVECRWIAYNLSPFLSAKAFVITDFAPVLPWVVDSMRYEIY